MPTPPDPRSIPSPSSVTPQHAAVFDLCLQQAAEGGRSLMEALLADVARLASLRTAEQREAGRADALGLAAPLLNRHAATLCEQYPVALQRAFADVLGSEPARMPLLSDLRFDQLELMDDAQVQEKMELARAQQTALLDAEAPLAELNALVSTVQGFKTVQPERNPFRPACYVNALREVFALTGVGAGVRLEWMQLAGTLLGRLLRGTYGELSGLLKNAGVDPAAFLVTQSGSSAPAAPATPLLSREEALLTVEQLRRLVTGELGSRQEDGGQAAATGDGGDAGGAAATAVTAAPPAPRYYRRATDVRRRASDGARRASDPSAQDGAADAEALQPNTFEHTVPAALEVLQEMQQVEQAMARLAGRGGQFRRRAGQNGRRSEDPEPPPDSQLGPTELAGLEPTALYDSLRQQATGVGQVLGLEVVTLMVENIVKDPRLLPPVQEAVQALASPLLRLAMVDPRFFSDKGHPARELLEAIVEHSARFEAADTTAFRQFIQPLRQVVDELQRVPVEGPEPFAQSLATLRQQWESHMAQERQQREQAVNALRQAEQRNLLAVQVAQDIGDRADAAFVPAPVFNFATGPWAQVIAHARLVAASPPTGELAKGPPPLTAEQCMGLVGDLFWSVHPELARADSKRLVRLIPGLLSRLRAGLRGIDYPQSSVTAFFEELMALHQKLMVTRPAPAPATAPAASAPARAAPARAASPAAAPAAPSLVDADFLSGVIRSPVAPWKAAPKSRPPEPEQVWLAPNEAQASGFLGDFQFSDFPTPGTGPGAASAKAPLVALDALPPDADATAIPQGSWVDLTTDSGQMRAELVWSSPEGTMYMFTTATGRNQSMTRRSLDKLIQRGMVKLLQRQDVLGNALDAVAQAALRNSVGKPEA